MATGTSQEWSKTGDFQGKLRISYSTVYDPATNKSTVTIRPQFWSKSSLGNDYRFYNYGNLNGAGIYVNGERVYTFGNNYGSGNYLSCGNATQSWANLNFTETFQVDHDSNGYAGFTVGIYCAVRAMYTGTWMIYPIGGKVSNTILLHENAASTIQSCTESVETGGTISLEMHRIAETNYHIATFKKASDTLYTSAHFDSSLSFTVPRTWFTDYSSDDSLTVDVSVQTYMADDTAVGDPAEAEITVTADTGMKPSVSAGWAVPSAYNTGAVLGFTGYIKGYSKSSVAFDSTKIDMTDAVGASIASCSVSCQGETATGNPAVTPVLATTSVPLVCTVTDTRGRTASETITLTVMDYSPPVLSGQTVVRCNSLGTADEDGTYFSVEATLSYSSLDGQNDCSTSPACFKTAVAAAGGAYGTATTLTSGTASVIGTYSADLSHTVKIWATDKLGNTAVYYAAMPTRKWAMKFRSNGSGVAFGKAAESNNTFEVASTWDAVFGKDVSVGNDISVTRDASVGRNASVTGTLGVGGAVTLTTALGISSGGTGATTAADARDNLAIIDDNAQNLSQTWSSQKIAGAVGVTITSLWTNSSPSSNFAAQAVSADLTGYDYYAVRMRFGANYDRNLPIGIFPVDGSTNQISMFALNNNQGGARTFSYSSADKEVSFADGHYNGNTSNAMVIPIEILGIKLGGSP